MVSSEEQAAWPAASFCFRALNTFQQTPNNTYAKHGDVGIDNISTRLFIYSGVLIRDLKRLCTHSCGIMIKEKQDKTRWHSTKALAVSSWRITTVQRYTTFSIRSKGCLFLYFLFLILPVLGINPVSWVPTCTQCTNTQTWYNYLYAIQMSCVGMEPAARSRVGDCSATRQTCRIIRFY